MDGSELTRCPGAGILLLVLSTFCTNLPYAHGTCDVTGTKVNCESQGLTSLPADLPVGMTHLIFSNNKLTGLGSKTFFNFTSLETINLSNNKIDEVAIDAFEGLLSLVSLNLQGNKITNLHANSFIDLKWVVTIDMSDNPLGDFPIGVFEDCVRLSRLELCRTGLDERDFGKIGILPKLDYLDLSGNTFAYLPYLMLLQFGSLSQLWLNNCSVQSIDPNAFVGLRAMRTLKLVDNQITHLKREIFQPLQLSYLELQGNPLECDCGMSHFKDLIDTGVFIGSQTCMAPDGTLYNIRTDDLTGFCTSVGPPVTDPCGGKGSLSLVLTEVTHDEAEIMWQSTSIPSSLSLSANLRIYANKGTETWETIVVSRQGYTFKRLKEGSDYILCVIQRQCELYACLDFSTKSDPRIGSLKDPVCITSELTAGIAVVAAFLTLMLGMATAYLVLRGVCCCPQNEQDSPSNTPGPMRRTQPVFPMQMSQSYLHSSDKHRHSSTDTYDAIPLETMDVNQHGKIFYNPSYRRKERPRNVNDPLPPINDAHVLGNVDVLAPSHGSQDQVIQGVTSFYLHPTMDERDAMTSHVSPGPGMKGNKGETYLQPAVIPLKRRPSTKHFTDLVPRHTINNALSTSDPYHVYQEASDDVIIDDPLPPDRRRSDGQSPAMLTKQFGNNKLTLDEIKQQIESGAVTGKVKKFRRPVLQSDARSNSTPDILRQNSELPRDERLLQSNA